MSERLTGKVALVTGAARGQGRSHALRLAQDGADIVAVDICEQIETVYYPMSTPEDLDQTVAAVEELDRRIVARRADVRDAAGLNEAVATAVDELGRIDIVVANAGIAPVTVRPADHQQTFSDVIAVNLTGVYNTVHAVVDRMLAQGDGGSIVLTSSTQGLSGRGGNGTGALDGYAAAKHGVVGLMRTWAYWLAPHHIRVNTVHPTGVETPMVENEVIAEWLEADPDAAGVLANRMPVTAVAPRDISAAIAWLVSDEARYVTGVTLPVDAGFLVT